MKTIKHIFLMLALCSASANAFSTAWLRANAPR